MAPSSWKGKRWWSNPYKPLSLLGKGGGRVTMVRYRLSLPTQWMGGGGGGGLAHIPPSSSRKERPKRGPRTSMGLEVDLVMPFGGEALAAREVDDRQSVACVQVIWPWSAPFPFPEEGRSVYGYDHRPFPSAEEEGGI